MTHHNVFLSLFLFPFIIWTIITSIYVTYICTRNWIIYSFKSSCCLICVNNISPVIISEKGGCWNLVLPLTEESKAHVSQVKESEGCAWDPAIWQAMRQTFILKFLQLSGCFLPSFNVTQWLDYRSRSFYQPRDQPGLVSSLLSNSLWLWFSSLCQYPCSLTDFWAYSLMQRKDIIWLACLVNRSQCRSDPWLLKKQPALVMEAKIRCLGTVAPALLSLSTGLSASSFCNVVGKETFPRSTILRIKWILTKRH